MLSGNETLVLKGVETLVLSGVEASIASLEEKESNSYPP